MKKTRSEYIGIIFLLALNPHTPALAQEEILYRLNPADISCLQNNRSVYEEIKKFPAIVSLSTCPDLPQNPLMGQVLNEGPTVNIDDRIKFDTFIFVTERNQIRCLLDAKIPDDTFSVVFSPRECRIVGSEQQ